MRPSAPHTPQGGCAAGQNTEHLGLAISGAYLPLCPSCTMGGSKELTQGPPLPQVWGRGERCWQWTLWQELRQRGEVSAGLQGRAQKSSQGSMMSSALQSSSSPWPMLPVANTSDPHVGAGSTRGSITGEVSAMSLTSAMQPRSGKLLKIDFSSSDFFLLLFSSSDFFFN